MTTRIKLRRDDTTNWDALNPVLALGEPGYNTTENKIKIGDGVTAWVDLPYLTDAQGTSFTLTPATTNALGGVKLGEGFVLNGSNQVTTSKLYSTNESDSNVHYRLTLDNNGVVVLPDQSIINGSTMRGVYGTGELNYTGITIGPDADHREESWVWVDASGAHIGARYSGDISDTKQWDFNNDGDLIIPPGGDIKRYDGEGYSSVLGGGSGGSTGNLNIYNNIIESESGNTFVNFGGPTDDLVLGTNADRAFQISLNEGSGYSPTWTFQTDGTLIVPDNGIAFGESSFIRNRDEEGLILWQNDNSGLNNNEYVGLWYGGDVVDHDSPNVSITAGSYNWATDDDNLQYINYPDQGADQGLRQINLDIRLDNDNILNWHFDTSGNFYLPADPSVVGVAGIVFPDGTVQTTASSNTGTSFEAPLPSWIDVISGTQHLPHVNTDYGFDSLGAWTVNATTGFDQEGTSYPFRTSFSIANNLKTVVTVDFDHQYGGSESDSDFGIGIFAAGTDPVWAWDGTSGNPDANRIGAQYNGSEPQLHGISGGQGAEYNLPEYGTYRARLTVEPIEPGVAEITLETLDTNDAVLNTITYTETSFFDTDYKIGFASDQDDGAPRVYFKNLSINVDVGSAIYSDALTTYSSVLVATNSELSNNGFTVTLKTDGSLELPQLSTIADVEAGVELTINRESPNWYSVYGDLNTQSTANATVTGSVTSDAGGNVYVLGSIVETGNFDGNNLLLKYNTEGELQWSRTWTDADGMNCGSYNATTRYLPPTAGTSDRETMYYASYVGGGITRPYSYVGTMDMEGELVDGFGNVRAAVEFANIRIADIEVGVGSNVYVVGARIENNFNNVTPFIAKVNLDTYTANLALTVSSYYHDSTNTNPWTNFFKSATHDGTALYTIGTYYNDDFGYDWPILTKHIDGGYTRTYHLTNSNQYANIYGEEVAYSTVNDAVYVLMNSTDSDDYAVIGELASDLSEYTWIRRFGNNGIQVRLFSMEFDADGFIYIIGDLSGVDNGEFILIKMAANGDLVWQRKIGTTADYEGSGDNEFGPPGWSSSSSIIIDGTDIVFTGLTVGARFNAVTMKYPTDGSLTGDFGNFHAVEYDVGFVDDWGDSIYDRTADTSVTEINGDSDLVNDINSASLLATTKTLESGFSTYHWDMTNNHRYIAERKWTFGIDGSITLPSGAYLEEDEPGTLIIHSTGGTAINYSKHAQVADYQEGETTYSGVAANSTGVTIQADRKTDGSPTSRQFNQWQFNNNGGLVFPDNTVQYGAYLNEEIMLDGGSAITVFPINVTTPRFVEGGGSGSRYGTTSPSYDGSSGGAYTNPNDFTLLLNGGGA